MFSFSKTNLSLPPSTKKFPGHVPRSALRKVAEAESCRRHPVASHARNGSLMDAVGKLLALADLTCGDIATRLYTTT